jgi:hypothetical protein
MQATLKRADDSAPEKDKHRVSGTWVVASWEPANLSMCLRLTDETFLGVERAAFIKRSLLASRCRSRASRGDVRVRASLAASGGAIALSPKRRSSPRR